MGDHHVGLFDRMIESFQLHDFLSNMVRSTNTSISLKGLEIVENFTKYYVQCWISKFTENENEAQQSAEDEQPEIDVLTIGPTRIRLIRLLANVTSISIETHGNTNAYIEFSTLTLLHLLFHSIMPVPWFSSDIFKSENTDMFNKKDKYKDIREIDPINKPQLEIIDPYYLTIRLDFVFSVWPYVKVSLDSTWTCIKKVVYKVLACILKNNLQIYDLTQNKKLKKEFSLLLKSLLETNDSESKKSGLYILGSFWGLGHDYDLPSTEDIDSKDIFRRNCGYIPTVLWQNVFKLQYDWDNNIKDAANILVQLWAPRNSIKLLNQTENESYELKLSEIQNKLSISKAFRIGSSFDNSIDYDNEESKENSNKEDNIYQEYSNRDQSNTELQSPSSSSENNSFKDETDVEFNERFFYVDKYDSDQIKQLVKLFIIKVNSDQKSLIEKSKMTCNEIAYDIPENLWVEKQNTNNDKNTVPNSSNDSQSIQKLTDFIEDSLDAKSEIWEPNSNQTRFYSSESNTNNDSKTPEVTAFSPGSHDESEYLIFERHFEPKPYSNQNESDSDSHNETSNNPNNEKYQNYDEELNTEDLGIIDLEDDDGFDNIDDDKLPVLKNTYSKKNRPNNSKSVAAGSKSKANRIDFGREDVGPDTGNKSKSQESSPDKNEPDESSKVVENNMNIENFELQNDQDQRGKSHSENIPFASQDDQDQNIDPEESEDEGEDDGNKL